jgi:hypothetical protein
MPDAPPPTSRATNDELAALYLRDRDTPCPSCNYNRRDGTTSTCPECATELVLVGTNSMLVPKYDKLAKAGLLIGTILALSKVAVKSYTTAFPLLRIGFSGDIGYIFNDDRVSLYYLVSMCTYLLWVVLFVIVLRRWLIARKGKTISSKKITAPLMAMLLLTACEPIFFAFARIYFIY